MNFMSEAGTNELWTRAPADSPSRYARMIPGISAVPQPRTAQRAAFTAIPNAAAKAEAAKPSQPETLTHLLLPHPIADPLTLYQLVIADLLLLGACSRH
jgi:hypothetical protein